jgi:RNA polymerase sigma-70 factor (ECF subfamily)
VIERRESASLVLQLLEKLPTNQREVIRLKFQNGFSYKEISRISGHSVSNVGFLIHTGLKTIRGQLAVGRPAEAQS